MAESLIILGISLFWIWLFVKIIHEMFKRK
jgi:hypothetical protein